MVGMRDFFKGKNWPRTRKQKFFAWGGALAVNLALFSVLAMTMELKIGFALPNMRNPLPVEVVSAEDFAALNAPEPTPPPKRQLRIDRTKPEPEPLPEPEPEPEPEPIKIPELKPEEEIFEPPQPETPPEPLIEEAPIEELPIAEPLPQEEPPVEDITVEELPIEEIPLAEIVPVEEAPLEEIIEEPIEEIVVEDAPSEALIGEPISEQVELAETMPPEDAPFIEEEIEEPPIEELAEQEPDPFAITAERVDILPEQEEEETEEAVADIEGEPDLPPIANAPPANPDDPYAGLSGPEIDALYKQRSLPAVNLPQASAGGSSGVTAIFCPDVFDNDDKVQECAGRPEIRSGWQPGNEDWSEVIDSLQRGGVATVSNPQMGPAGDRKQVPGSRHAQPTTSEAILGRGQAENIKDAKGIAALKEISRGVEEQTQIDMMGAEMLAPNYITDTMEPSWTLSDKTRMEREMLEKMRELEREGQSIDLEKDKE